MQIDKERECKETADRNRKRKRIQRGTQREYKENENIKWKRTQSWDQKGNEKNLVLIIKIKTDQLAQSKEHFSTNQVTELKKIIIFVPEMIKIKNI